MSDSINTIQNRLTDVCSIDYEALKSSFDLLKVSTSPVALQGELCGYLCAGRRFDAQQWLDQVVEILHLSEKPDNKSAIIQFVALKVNTQSQLEGTDFELDMVLPNDDMPLDTRLNELAQWCMSFLTAFALADGQSLMSKLSKEGQEVFSDLTSISQVSAEVGEAMEGESSESESDFFSVQEHVKMGVLMIFTELNPKPTSPQENPSNPSQPPTIN